MKLDKILGKMLALTKQIFFKEPIGGYDFRTSFLTGGRDPFSLIGSLGLEWWFAKPAGKIRDDIANMSISYCPDLKGGDRLSFCKIIVDVLQENALNSELFDGDRVLLRNADTLFECRSVQNEKEFALRLWNKIYHAMEESLIKWIVLYPLPKVEVHTAALGFDGITLLSSNDKSAWEQVCQSYSSNARFWNPSSGMDKDDKESLFKKPISTWLLCEVYGTESAVIELARRCMRTFIAVLFSYLQEKFRNLLTKSMADEISYSVVFPQAGAKAKIGQSYTPISRLLPPLIIDVNILPEDVSEIRKWYKLHSSACHKYMQRATTASHFIHYAIMADDLERFIHFFIALDALFGERDKVQDSIISGIKKTFSNDVLWENRAERLFDLRSELIHGGSSMIEDWKDLDHYRGYFKSHPLEDVGFAAMTALRNYFSL